MKVIAVEEYATGNPYNGASYPAPGVYEVGNGLFLVYRATVDGSLVVVGMSSAKELVRDIADATTVENIDAAVRTVAAGIVDVHLLVDQIRAIVQAAASKA
jgi:N-acyl-D-aspartate/D-glutamate deacylase